MDRQEQFGIKGDGINSGQDETTKRKRQESPISFGGTHGGTVASTMEFVRVFMDDANRKSDAMSQLREKVTMLEVAEHARQLAEKEAKIQRLHGELTALQTASKQSYLTEDERAGAAAAVQEASEQRVIAGAVAVDLRRMTLLKEVIVCVVCWYVVLFAWWDPEYCDVLCRRWKRDWCIWRQRMTRSWRPSCRRSTASMQSSFRLRMRIAPLSYRSRTTNAPPSSTP